MNTDNKDNAIVLSEEVNNLPEVMQTAPEILMQNKQSMANATKGYNKIEELIAENGMNDVYDGQLASFIEKGKKTIKAMNERRAPITQMMSVISKEFTGAESSLKTIVDSAQGKRNDFVTLKMKQKQEEERIAQLKLAKDKELIDFKKICEITASNFFISATNQIKETIVNFFNELTIESVKTANNVLSTTSTNFDTYFPEGLKLVLPVGEESAYNHLTAEEKQAIKDEYTNADYSTNKADFKKELESTIREYIDKIPSKTKELEELAVADAAEADRILAEKKAREDAEKKVREDAEKKAREDAQAQAAVSAAGATAVATVETQATLFTEAPKVAESYEIVVSDISGYMALTAFWFEKEGKTLAFDKFENYTFARIKAFCERYAKSNDEFVQSESITYNAKYKAK